jgi:predicted TIM-barrel fold metal-dependent hydrolase
MHIGELALETPNLYLDISTVAVVFAARMAIRELPERALFGSDAPYGDPLLARRLIERVSPPGEVLQRVLGGNLAELLRLA